MTDLIDAPDATWTVTSEERREFMRAYWLWWWRQPSIVVVLCVGAGVVIGMVAVLGWNPIVAVGILLIDLALFGALAVWRIRQTYPVGETFRSWAGSAAYRLDGPGVSMEINWDRITAVDVRSSTVHLRTRTPKRNLLVARQVLGEQARARLERRADGLVPDMVSRNDAPGERSVVVDRRLQIALCVAAVRRFRVAGSIVAVAVVLIVVLGLIGADPWSALRTAGVLMLALVAVFSVSVVPTIGAYPVGSTISGSLGEYLVVRGSWGRTSIHQSRLNLVAKTKHAFVFRSGATWVIVPRAILVAESVSPGVRDMRRSTHG